MANHKTIRALLTGGALAAGLATLGFASQAAATEQNPTTSLIQLQSATMNTSYTANVGVPGQAQVDAYSNGVTFSYINLDPITAAPIIDPGQSAPTVYTIFGFCVDITHDMFINTPLGYNYTSGFSPSGPSGNPLPTDFHGNTITAPQLARLSALIDTGFLLHQSEAGKSADYIANVELQLAAIQAAIWSVEGGNVSLNGGGDTAGSGDATGTVVLLGGDTYDYQGYFDAYASGSFHDLGDANDTFYTIVEKTPSYDGNQSFAIGWPLSGTPEPATWAMMLVGFGGMGALLRARRKLAVLAN